MIKHLTLLAISILLLSFGCKNEPSSTTNNSTADTAKATTSNITLDSINQLILQDPNNPDLYHQRAKYYLTKRQFEEAGFDLSRTMNIDSSKAEYFITLADFYFYTNKTGNSKAALEKCIKLDPKNSDGYMKLAELYFYVTKYQEALNNLNQVLKINQYNAKAYFLKGMVYKEIGDTVKAVSSMQTAVEQNPDYYQAYIELGVILTAKNDPLAIAYYDNAIRLKPSGGEAFYNKGMFFQKRQDWNKAIECYTNATLAEPGFKYPYYNLGYIHLAHLNLPKQAIDYFNKAVKVDQKYVEAYFGLGTCYETLGDQKKALDYYRLTLSLNPQYAPAAESVYRILNN